MGFFLPHRSRRVFSIFKFSKLFPFSDFFEASSRKKEKRGKSSVLAKNGAFLQASRGRHVGGLARSIRRWSHAAAHFFPNRQPLAHSVLTSQPGRFSGRIGRLESLPRYAPILILEQAITGTVPGSACGKASVLAKNGAFLQASRGRHVGGLARFIRRRSRAAAQSVPISQPLALGSLPPAPVMQASQSFRSSQSLLGGITGRRGFSGAILRRRPLPGAIPRRRAPFRGNTPTQGHECWGNTASTHARPPRGLVAMPSALLPNVRVFQGTTPPHTPERSLHGRATNGSLHFFPDRQQLALGSLHPALVMLGLSSFSSFTVAFR